MKIEPIYKRERIYDGRQVRQTDRHTERKRKRVRQVLLHSLVLLKDCTSRRASVAPLHRSSKVRISLSNIQPLIN